MSGDVLRGQFGGGYSSPYAEETPEQPQQAQQQQAPRPTGPTPIRPDVIYAPPPSRVNPQGAQYFPLIPDFSSMASKVDAIARRIPWWVWFAGTIGVMYWMDRRKGKRGASLRLLGD